MNFLAHTMFANNDPELIVGQFCGDFVRGSDLGAFPVRVRHGILQHRQIDRFTDRHDVNRAARDLFEPPLRRFAGILTDIVYDHFLALSWSDYCRIPLETHVDQVNDALAQHFELLPLKLQRFSRFLADREVLLSYRRFDAVDAALWRLSRRSERFLLLDEAADIVQANLGPLSTCFHQFYPDLIAFMAEARALPPSDEDISGKERQQR